MTATMLARAAGAAALVAGAVVVAGAPAQAAAYRYWTYWQAPAGDDAWSFAIQGPATAMPADGAVEGWAFGVTTDAAGTKDAPAVLPDFAALCGDTEPTPGSKRVGLIIDPGARALAPEDQVPPPELATCVVAPEDASGYDILRAAVEVRTEDGLVCGVDGYPTGECAPVLTDAQAAEVQARIAEADVVTVEHGGADMAPQVTMDAEGTTAEGAADTGSGTPWATVTVIALIALIATAIIRARRRAQRGAHA